MPAPAGLTALCVAAHLRHAGRSCAPSEKTSMPHDALIEAALTQTIEEIPALSARKLVSGKVRDVFEFRGKRLALVVTDRSRSSTTSSARFHSKDRS